jgi:hypothetical protein
MARAWSGTILAPGENYRPIGRAGFYIVWNTVANTVAPSPNFSGTKATAAGTPYSAKTEVPQGLSLTGPR